MKNKFKYICRGLVLISFLSLSSCDDYLSELPDNRALINTKEKVSSLLTGAYSQQNYMLMAELMSDNVTDKGNLDQTRKLEEQIYNWQNSDDENQDSPIAYWNDCYRIISQANQALASIEELGGQSDLKAQKGEALLCRAYAHFMLVNFWAKTYNPQTAKTDLGVPYVTKPEKVLIKDYKRNTVQEVYDLIEKDLIEGLSLVQDDYEQPKFHFTKEAGYAFATRFYLYKGDWDKVITYSSELLRNPESQIRDRAAYSKLNINEYIRMYASPSENNNLLIASTSSWWDRRAPRSRFGLTNSLMATLFQGGSGNPFGKQWAYPSLNYGDEFSYHFPAFEEYFKYSNRSAGIGLGYVGIVLFDVDEAILNRAEAYAMKKDYNNALKDLTIFASKKTTRYRAATDVLTERTITTNYGLEDGVFTPFYALESGTQTAFINAVAELRRRQFCQQGLRWFDIRRFDIKVTHKLKNKPDIILEKGSPRRVLQIPPVAQKTLKPNNREKTTEE